MMLSVGGGSFGAFESSLSAGINSGQFKGVVGARLFSEDGWNYHATTTLPGVPYQEATADLDYGEKKLGIFTQLGYKGLQLTGFFANFDENSLGLSPSPGSDISMNGSRWFFDLGFHGQLSEKWETNLNLTLNLMRFRIRDTNTKAHIFDINSWGYLGEASVSGRLTDSLNLIVGGVFDVRKNIDTDLSLLRGDYSQTHLAAYTQLDYTVFDGFKLIGGAQLNKPYQGDVDVVPRLGFIYHFKKGFSVKGLYGQAFRSPWPDEQEMDTSVLKGNPDLKPEKIATLDLQLSYQTSKARFSLTYFHSKTSDLILSVPDETTGGSTYANTPGYKSDGVEFEMKASLFKDFLLTGSALVMDNGDEASFASTSMFKVGASYRTPFGLNMGLFLTHFGKRPKNQGAVLNPEADAVNLLSLNFGYKFPGKLPLEIVLYAQNLLDDGYYFPEYVYGWTNTLPNGPGRAIYSKIILRL
jgi:outer membrane receptor for ferrienterochelin and colicins